VYDANAHRGKKRKAGVDSSCLPIIEDEASLVPSRGWAEMIRKVYEIDPLICPKCGGQMPACALYADRKVFSFNIRKMIVNIRLAVATFAGFGPFLFFNLL